MKSRMKLEINENIIKGHLFTFNQFMSLKLLTFIIDYRNSVDIF